MLQLLFDVQWKRGVWGTWKKKRLDWTALITHDCLWCYDSLSLVVRQVLEEQAGCDLSPGASALFDDQKR